MMDAGLPSTGSQVYAYGMTIEFSAQDKDPAGTGSLSGQRGGGKVDCEAERAPGAPDQGGHIGKGVDASVGMHSVYHVCLHD